MAINDNPNNPNIDGVRGREATPEEIARRDGYVQGRNDENYVQGAVRGQERAVAQQTANDSAASGLIVGLMIALLAAGVGAAVYFLSGNSTPTPVVAPEVEQPPKVEKEIIREKTIIERNNTTTPAPTPEVNIEAPQAPSPDVNIINQEPAPAEPAAEPAAEPEAEPAAEPETEAPAGTN